MNKIAVLTGAGVSAESGLGTYRDNGGLWDNYDPAEVASIEGWMRNPGKVLDFYNMQRRNLEKVQPNEAHRLIAELEKKYRVDVSPRMWTTFTKGPAAPTCCTCTAR